MTVSGKEELKVIPGTPIKISVKATDKDGNPVVLSAKFDSQPLDGSLIMPNGPTFESFGGKGTFTWTPGPSDAGDEHKVYFKATDVPPAPLKPKSASEDVAIHIMETKTENQAPTLDEIPATFAVQAGNTVTVNLSATDPNTGDELTFKADKKLPGASMVQKGLNSATGKWEAQYTYWTKNADKGKSKKLKFTVVDNADNAKQKSRSTTIKIK